MSDERLSPKDIQGGAKKHLVDFLSKFDTTEELREVIGDVSQRRSELDEPKKPNPKFKLSKQDFPDYRKWERQQRGQPIQEISLTEAYERFVVGDKTGVWELVRGLQDNPQKLYEFLGLETPTRSHEDLGGGKPTPTQPSPRDENQQSAGPRKRRSEVEQLLESINAQQYGFNPERFKEMINKIKEGVYDVLPSVIMFHPGEENPFGKPFVDLKKESEESLVKNWRVVLRKQYLALLQGASQEAARAAQTAISLTEPYFIKTSKTKDLTESLAKLTAVLAEPEASKSLAGEWDKLRGNLDAENLETILHSVLFGFRLEVDTTLVDAEWYKANEAKIEQLGLVMSVSDIMARLRGQVRSEKNQRGEVLYRSVNGDTTKRYTRAQFSDQRWQTLINKGVIMPAYDRPVGGLFNTAIDQAYFSTPWQESRFDGLQTFYDEIENEIGQQMVAIGLVDVDGNPDWAVIKGFSITPNTRIVDLDREFLAEENKAIRLGVLEDVLKNGSDWLNDQTKAYLGPKLIDAGFVDADGNPDWGVMMRYLSSKNQYKDRVFANINHLGVSLYEYRSTRNQSSPDERRTRLEYAELVSLNLNLTLSDQTKAYLGPKLIDAGFVDADGNPDWKKLLQLIYSPKFQANHDNQQVLSQIINDKTSKLEAIIMDKGLKPKESQLLFGNFVGFTKSDELFEMFIKNFTKLDPNSAVRMVRTKQTKLLWNNLCYQDMEKIVNVGLGISIFLKDYDDLIPSALFVDRYPEGAVRSSGTWHEFMNVAPPSVARLIRKLFGAIATELRGKSDPLFIAARGNPDKVSVGAWLEPTSSGDSSKHIIQPPLVFEGGIHRNLTLPEQKKLEDIVNFLKYEPMLGASEQAELDGLFAFLQQAYHEAVVAGCDPQQLGDHVIAGTTTTIDQLANSILHFQYQRQKNAYTFVPRRSEQIALILERIQNASDSSPLSGIKNFLQSIDLTSTMQSVSNKKVELFAGLGVAGMMRWNLEYGDKEVYSGVKNLIKPAEYQKAAMEIQNKLPALYNSLQDLHRDMREIERDETLNFVPDKFFGAITLGLTEKARDMLPHSVNNKQQVVDHALAVAKQISELLALGSFLKGHTERFILELIHQTGLIVNGLTPAYKVRMNGRDSTIEHLQIPLDGLGYEVDNTGHLSPMGYVYDHDQLDYDRTSKVGIVETFLNATTPEQQDISYEEFQRVSRITEEYVALLKSIGASTAFEHLNSPRRLYRHVENMVGGSVDQINQILELPLNLIGQSMVLRALQKDVVQLPRSPEIVAGGVPLADVAISVKNLKQGPLVSVVYMKGLHESQFGDGVYKSPNWTRYLIMEINNTIPNGLSVDVVQNFEERLAAFNQNLIIAPAVRS